VNPAHQLLYAHLRKQEERIRQLSADLLKAYERNAVLQEDNRLLRIKVCQLRESRDRWKAKAVDRARRAMRHRRKAKNQWSRAETWRHRALASSTTSPARSTGQNNSRP
jgi:hypothetical protein